jgi:hypothetical protein
MAHGGKTGFKDRAIEELKLFWLTALYLWIFLGSFTTYRRLIIAETGTTYLHYGIALVEALIIAKVILIGRLFGFSRRFEDKPLIVPVLYKSILFVFLAMLFGVVEHLVEGWVHEHRLVAGFDDLVKLGAHELGARSLMLFVAFIPFFAFWELGRVLGAQRLAAMFFSKIEVPDQAESRGCNRTARHGTDSPSTHGNHSCGDPDE